MENRSHALIAGLFVLLLGLATAGAVWWLGQGGMVAQRYVLETRKSVTGLNVQGQVRYRGIRAGKVEVIDTDPADPALIRVIVAVDQRFRITRGASAHLGYQGVTGIAYVQIEEDGTSNEPLVANTGELPRIPMREGVADGLTERAGKIMEQVQRTTERLNALFDQRNIDNIARTLDNLASSSERLREMTSAENLQRWQRILGHVEATAGEAAPLAAEVRHLVRTMSALAQRGDELLRQADAAGSQLNAHTLPQAEQLLRELTATSRQLARVLEGVERDPQMFVFGTTTARPGPGETGFVAPPALP